MEAPPAAQNQGNSDSSMNSQTARGILVGLLLTLAGLTDAPAIPSRGSHFGKPGDAVLLQKFPPLPKGKTGVIEIEYSPPGASCIPTPMVLVPIEH